MAQTLQQRAASLKPVTSSKHQASPRAMSPGVIRTVVPCLVLWILLVSLLNRQHLLSPSGISTLERPKAQKPTVCSDHDAGVLSATDGLAGSCEELVATAGFDTVCRSGEDDTVAMVEALCRVTCGLCQQTSKMLHHSLKGRLGNQLFQYSSTVGIADVHGMAACIGVVARGSGDLATYFDGVDTGCTSPRPKKHVSENKKYATHNVFEFVGDTVLDGYLQSFKYFSQNVRGMIRMKPSILTKASNYLAPFKSHTTVGIHVRHGDLLKYDYIRFPPDEYFLNVLSYFRTKYSNAQFVVASDDTDWCSKQVYFVANDVRVVTEKHNPVMDMAILAGCDHMVTTVGTFGWWAAYFGADAKGGEVVYYDSQFILEHPNNKGNVVLEDYYPEGWTAMGVVRPTSNPTFNADNASCGVVWFYHIPKTGGSSVNGHLRREGGCFQFWGRLKTYVWEDYFAHVENLVLSTPTTKRMECVHHHHAGPMLHEFMPVLERWKHELHSRGCNLWMTIVLRDPDAQIISELGYNKVGHHNLQAWLTMHQSVQTQYLLFNHFEYFSGNFANGQYRPATRTTSTGLQLTPHIHRNTTYLHEAIELIKKFDVVGQTHKLEAFVFQLEALLGRPHKRIGKANRTPKENFVSWSTDELAAIKANVAFDRQLVAAAVPYVKIKPSVTLLFLIIDKLPFWNQWPTDHPQINTLIHAEYPERVDQSQPWAKHVLSKTTRSEWVQTTDAMVLLLETALGRQMQRHAHDKFCFSSESTLPLQEPDVFVETLTAHKWSIIGHDHHQRYDQRNGTKGYLKFDARHPLFNSSIDSRPHPDGITVFKTGQWNCLNFADALLAVQEFPKWQKRQEEGTLPKHVLRDPQFFVSLLVGTHHRDMVIGPLSYQEWAKKSNHPYWLAPSKREFAAQRGFLTARKFKPQWLVL